MRQPRTHLDCLDENRIANLLGLFSQKVGVLIVTVVARGTRYARFGHDLCIVLHNCREREQRVGCTFFDSLFDPIETMAEAGGPMKTIPSFANLSANPAFSLRKP